MGPIVGAGFALAIYDFDLLKRSGKNLIIATVVSLAVATIYFFISPFKETQSELLARTSPNIYDVLIAFFGGLVGVIALTRTEKGNPIPGVAIATALMPPLCTAGYGLAIGNFTFFFGAFYLYCINCFFICISTLLIIKYLKYPAVKNLNAKYEKQIRLGITTFLFVLILPSFYLAYTLFQEKKFNQKIEQFVTTEFTENGYVLIYKNIRYNTSPKQLELAFLTHKFSPQELEQLKSKLLQYEIENTELKIRQDTKDIKREILIELRKQNNVLLEKDILINDLQNELNAYNVDDTEIKKEISILFPELKDVIIGRQTINKNTDSLQITSILLYQTAKKNEQIDTAKIRLWLCEKLNTTDIKLVKQN